MSSCHCALNHPLSRYPRPAPRASPHKSVCRPVLLLWPLESWEARAANVVDLTVEVVESLKETSLPLQDKYYLSSAGGSGDIQVPGTSAWGGGETGLNGGGGGGGGGASALSLDGSPMAVSGRGGGGTIVVYGSSNPPSFDWRQIDNTTSSADDVGIQRQFTTVDGTGVLANSYGGRTSNTGPAAGGTWTGYNTASRSGGNANGRNGGNGAPNLRSSESTYGSGGSGGRRRWRSVWLLAEREHRDCSSRGGGRWWLELYVSQCERSGTRGNQQSDETGQLWTWVCRCCL